MSVVVTLLLLIIALPVMILLGVVLVLLFDLLRHRARERKLAGRAAERRRLAGRLPSSRADRTLAILLGCLPFVLIAAGIIFGQL
jgi:hypothetical protein